MDGPLTPEQWLALAAICAVVAAGRVVAWVYEEWRKHGM